MPPAIVAWCPAAPLPSSAHARTTFAPPPTRNPRHPHAPPRRRPRPSRCVPPFPPFLRLDVDVGADPPPPRGVLTDSDLDTKWKQPSDTERRLATDKASSAGAGAATTVADNGPAPADFYGEDDDEEEEGPTLSVLETKWKNDAARAAARPDKPPATPMPYREKPRRPPATSYRPPPNDPSASDPYEAFADFTRLAAPTAALGMSAASLSASAKAVATTAEATTPTEWAAAASRATADAPYSAGAITHRLLRYQRARSNLDLLISLFTGEFDNYPQVAAERRAGLTPGDGGGHEHIHCSVAHVAPGLLYARYYFDGDPGRVFRSRLYALRPCDDCEIGLVEMRIFRFYEQTLRKLRDASYEIGAVDWHDDDVYDWLRGCEVFWERYDPPESGVGAATAPAAATAMTDASDPTPNRAASEHARDAARDLAQETDPAHGLGIHPGTRFVGYMDGGGCECFSPEIGARIRVMDDLLLTEDELWVADRGFDESDNFVYGNRLGVPYKMTRVTPSGPLAWTLSTDASPPSLSDKAA